MIRNRMNRFEVVRNEEEPEAPNYSGEGLSARLEAFINKGSEEPKPTPSAPAEPKAPEEPQAPKGDQPDPGAGDEPDEEEEDFPVLGQKTEATPEKPDGEFDEAAFDAETEAEAKQLGAKAGEKFKALKAKLKETIKENASLKQTVQVPKEVEAELADLRAKAAEVEALRQRNQELLRVNDEIAVRESDEFINQVRKPVEEMEQIITKIAEGASMSPDDLFAVITETDIVKQDKMLDQLHSSLGSRMAGRIERFADDYKAIQAKSADMLANAPKHIEKSRMQRQQEEAENMRQRSVAFKSATEESFTKYAKRVPGFLDSSGNLTDLAKATMEKTSSIDPSTLTPSDLGYMAFAANAFPEARRAIVALEKELAVLRGSKPNPKPLDGKPNNPEPPEEEPQGLIERMRGKEFYFAGV